jgi:hypothetical protein
MYKALMMIGRQKHILLDHYYLNLFVFGLKIAIVRLNRYKSPGIDQLSAELIKQEVLYYILRYTE